MHFRTDDPPEELQSFLPGPAGPFGIGTRTFSVEDPTRIDFAVVDGIRSRRLLAQVWYPAETCEELSPLIDDSLLPSALASALGLPPVLEFLRTRGSRALLGASPLPGRHPLLFFLSGLAGFRQSNVFQVEHLVSHGYVVIGIDVPGISATVSFPDGVRIPALPAEAAADLVAQSVSPQRLAPRLNDREFPEGIITELTRDVRAILAFLQESSLDDFEFIDMSRIGAFGVSLGGITVAEILRTDPRVKAALMMDSPAPVAVARAGLDSPALWVTRDSASMRGERSRFGGWDEPSIELHQSSIAAAVSRSTNSWELNVNEMVHMDFTGAPYGSHLLRRMVSGPLGGRRAHCILNSITKAFFDCYLCGSPAADLVDTAHSLSEVTVCRRPPEA